MTATTRPTITVARLSRLKRWSKRSIRAALCRGAIEGTKTGNGRNPWLIFCDVEITWRPDTRAHSPGGYKTRVKGLPRTVAMRFCIGDPVRTIDGHRMVGHVRDFDLGTGCARVSMRRLDGVGMFDGWIHQDKLLLQEVRA